MSQFFQIFRLPEQFSINLSELEQSYRALTAQFHPDKFAAHSAFEQKQALMMSATINEAYRVLKNPLHRAAYLLKQHNIDADTPEHTQFAPEFLMQQMTWRETLMDAQINNNTSAITQLRDEIAQQQQQLQHQLQAAFDAEQWQIAAQKVREGRFLDKMQQEIAAILP